MANTVSANTASSLYSAYIRLSDASIAATAAWVAVDSGGRDQEWNGTEVSYEDHPVRLAAVAAYLAAETAQEAFDACGWDASAVWVKH